MKKTNSRVLYRNIFKLDWRIAWYGVMVWILSLMLSSVIILPWFYVIFPPVIFGITIFFFRKDTDSNLNFKNVKGVFFAQGLSVGLIWFVSILILDFFQLVGFDLTSATVYFLDPRNFMKYPIVILVPAIYGLIIENKLKFQRRVDEVDWVSQQIFRLHS